MARTLPAGITIKADRCTVRPRPESGMSPAQTKMANDKNPATLLLLKKISARRHDLRNARESPRRERGAPIRRNGER